MAGTKPTEQTGSGVEVLNSESLPPEMDFLLQVYLLNLPQIVQPTGNHVFKGLSQWGTFLIQMTSS